MPSHSLSYYLSGSSLDRIYIVKDGKLDGESNATTDYPYAVYREEQGALAVAEQSFQQWIRALKSSGDERNIKIWDANAAEGKRLYVSSFAGAYLDRVREQDVKSNKVPTSVTNEVTVIVTKVQRQPGANIYTLTIKDPYLQYPIIREFELDTTNLKVYEFTDEKGAKISSYGNPTSSR
jgi:hypothetical protein